MAGVVPADDPERRSRYEVLFRANYRAVQSYLMNRFPEADHPTILSRTFEIAWRRLDAIPDQAVRGWLISVARNCARNERRSARRRQIHLEMLVHARPRQEVDQPLTSETFEALRLAFAALKPRDREILLLAEWEGLGGDDLGAAIGVSGPTAAVRLHRARARLRALMSSGEQAR